MPIYLPWLTVLVACLAVAGATLAQCGSAAHCLVTSGFILVGCRLIKVRRRLCVLAVVPWLSFVYVQWRAPHPGVNDLAHYVGRQVVISAKSCGAPCFLGANRLVTCVLPGRMLFPDMRRLSGKVQLTMQSNAGWDEAFSMAGQTLRISGSVTAPCHAEQPWQMDAASYLRRQSIFCQITARRVSIEKEVEESPGESLWSCVQSAIIHIRSRVAGTHESNIGQEEGSLLTSMVLGERAVSVSPSIVQNFRTVGLSHLIAASGFNLTVVTALAYWFARFISRSRLMASIFAFASMAIFVLLAGFSASVLRAGLMSCFILIANYFSHSLHGLAALSFALFLTILIEPLSISDVGCQLSYAAAAGIICGADPLARLFIVESMPKLIRSCIEAASVVIAAQFAILPIQILHFWQIGLLFLPANLLVAFLVAPVTVLGFISSLTVALTMPLSGQAWAWPSWLLDILALYPLKAIILVAGYFASFQAAVLRLGAPHFSSVLIYYSGLLSYLYALRFKRHRLLCLLVFLAGSVLIFWPPRVPQLVLAFFPECMVSFGSEKQAFMVGRGSRQVERFLAYSGVRNSGDADMRQIGFPARREFVIASSRANYVIELARAPGSWSTAKPYIVRNGLAVELEDAKRPTVHLAIFMAAKAEIGRDELEKLAQAELLDMSKSARQADWLLVMYNDRTNNWREKHIVEAAKTARALPAQFLKCLDGPDIRLITCPHWGVAIFSRDGNQLRD